MKSKNALIILLLCGVCAFGGYMIGKDNGVKSDKNSISDKDDKSANKKIKEKEIEKNNIKEKNEDPEVKTKKGGFNVLDKALGEWGYCAGEYDCYELVFSKKDNKYVYNMFKMWSEPSGAGIVIDLQDGGVDKYKLTIHIDALETEMVSVPEQTFDVTFDYSHLSSGILKVNDKSFKKVVGDTEEFFKNLF